MATCTELPVSLKDAFMACTNWKMSDDLIVGQHNDWKIWIDYENGSYRAAAISNPRKTVIADIDDGIAKLWYEHVAEKLEYRTME
jgi:hypothetical protein